MTTERTSEVPGDEASRRKAVFAELRRIGNPDVLKLLEERGEDGIANPAVLLLVGACADAPLERPEQLPFEERDELV